MFLQIMNPLLSHEEVRERYGHTETYESHYGFRAYYHSMWDGVSSTAEMQREIIVNHIVDRVDAAVSSRHGQPSMAARQLGFAVHALEDAFSASHVWRNADGAIILYQDYNQQDPTEHSVADFGYTNARAIGERLRGNEGARRTMQDAMVATAHFLKLVVCKGSNFDTINSYLVNGPYRHAPDAHVPGPNRSGSTLQYER